MAGDKHKKAAKGAASTADAAIAKAAAKAGAKGKVKAKAAGPAIPARDDFTAPIRRAQHARLVIEMTDFFTGLAAEEQDYPAVPEEMLFAALAESIRNYASDEKQLKRVIDLLKGARKAMKG